MNTLNKYLPLSFFLANTCVYLRVHVINIKRETLSEGIKNGREPYTVEEGGQA
jgi:hypothetical protein